MYASDFVVGKAFFTVDWNGDYVHHLLGIYQWISGFTDYDYGNASLAHLNEAVPSTFLCWSLN